MKKNQSAVMACVGSVIGAGFASGREIIVFFTQYGRQAWWLIVLSALLMTLICLLCMHAAKTGCCCDGWQALLGHRRLPALCSVMLMIMTAGAMISAAGHVVALLWSHPQAYAVGVLGTIWIAMAAGRSSLKPLGVISAALSMLLLCVLMGAMLSPETNAVPLDRPAHGIEWFHAVLKAVGYAGMNMMLAIGVICRSAERTESPQRTAGLFGWVIAMLLMISHCVYARHPEVHGMAFPVVALLSAYGRDGYLAGAVVLYLAILTTLISVLYALRSATENCTERRAVRWLLVPGIPLAVSGLGFAGIVDRLYAPAGLVCMLLVFIPLAIRQWKTAKKPTFS